MITTLDRAITSTDPSYCGDAVTEPYLEQTEGSPGAVAFRACIEDAGDTASRADAIEVDDVTVDGQAATATVTYRGGSLDGSTMVLSLIEVDGEWLLNRVERFVHLDRSALSQDFRRQFDDELNRFSHRAAECALARIDKLPTHQLEAILLSGDRTDLNRTLVACDRPAFQSAIVVQFERNLPEVARCIERRLRRVSEYALAHLATDPVGVGLMAIRCDRGAYVELLTSQVEKAAGSVSAETSLCLERQLNKASNGRLARVEIDPALIEQVAAACGLDQDVAPS